MKKNTIIELSICLVAFVLTNFLSYHFQSPITLNDGKGWDGIEYFDVNRESGALYAFRGTDAASKYTFLLRGLQPDRRYRLHFKDASSPDRTLTGRELQQTGLTVSLPQAESSELVTIERAR